MAIGQIPYRRKSFDLPALVAIARAKCLLSNFASAASGCPEYTAVLVHSYNSPAWALSPAPHLPSLVPSLLLSPARRASLERFGRSSPLPALLQVSVRQSLESVAYAHTAADLHVRPVSITALVEDRGRREQLTNTPWGADGNKFDSGFCARKTALGAPQQRRRFPRKSKSLIRFADSSRLTNCDIFAELKNKRHISFKEAREERCFSKWCISLCR